MTGDVLTLIFESTIKGTLLLGVVAVLALALRRAPAQTRLRMWTIGLFSFVALPFLHIVLPSWKTDLAPRLEFLEPLEEAALLDASESTELDDGSTPESEIEGLEPETSFFEAIFDDGSTILSARPLEGPPSAGAGGGRWEPEPGAQVRTNEDALDFMPLDPKPERTPSRTVGAAWPWARILFFGWLTGAGLVGGSLIVALLRLRRLTRRATPVRDPSWRRLSDEFGGGCRRPVRLLASPEIDVPMTWGARNPVILLPRSAHEWNERAQRSVLVHELAHVQRGDWLLHLAVHGLCAIYWFHPLVWFAARRLCLETEKICDAWALRSGCKASEYAGHILRLAESMRHPRRANLGFVALTSRRDLRDRLVCLLAPRPARALSRVSGFAVLFSLIGLVLPLAALDTATSPSEAEPTPVESNFGEPDAGRADEPRPAPAPQSEPKPEESAPPEDPAYPVVPVQHSPPPPPEERPQPIREYERAYEGEAEEAAAPPPPAVHSVVIESHGGGCQSSQFHYTVNGLRIEVHWRGEIIPTPDDRDIASVCPNGYFILSVHAPGLTRRYEVHPDGRDGFRRTYFVDDRRTEQTTERAWLGRMLPDIFRQTGLAAEFRARRIYETDGVDGVLAEIALLPTQRVRGLYYRYLLRSNLTKSDTIRVLGRARTDLTSDGVKFSLLRRIVDSLVSDADLRNACFGFIESFNTDPCLRRVLKDMIRRVRDPVIHERAFRLAGTRIQSDSQLASLLADQWREGLGSEPVRKAYFGAIAKIESDAHMARVLKRLASRRDLDEASRRTVLRLAGDHLEHDHYLAAVLDPAARYCVNREKLAGIYFEVVGRISNPSQLSQQLHRLTRVRNLDANAHRLFLECATRLKGHDALLTHVLRQLLRRQKPNVENRLLMLQLAADGIESDPQMASFLEAAAEGSLGNDRVLAAYLKCATTIENSALLSQRLTKDMQRRNLTAAAIQALLETADGNLESDAHLCQFLRRTLSRRDLGSSERKRALEVAIRRLDGDHYLATLLRDSRRSCLRNADTIPLYFQAIDAMDTPHQIGEMLGAVVREKNLTSEHQRVMFEIASRRLEHDALRSQFLSRVDPRRAASKEVYPAYLEVLKKVEGDHFLVRELARALRADASLAFRRGLLQVAIDGLERDDSMARFLKEAAPRCVDDEELERLLFAAVRTIDNDSTQSTTLSRLPWKRMSKPMRIRLIELSACAIETESLRAELLRDISRYCEKDDDLRAAYRKAALSIQSERLRERVFSKIKGLKDESSRF